MIKVYHSIDSGLTNFIEVQIPLGTTLYHMDNPGCLKALLMHEVYDLLSDRGNKTIGKITIVHASF